MNMATEEDNFDIDIYGDGGGEDYQQEAAESVEAEQPQSLHQKGQSHNILPKRFRLRLILLLSTVTMGNRTLVHRSITHNRVK